MWYVVCVCVSSSCSSGLCLLKHGLTDCLLPTYITYLYLLLALSSLYSALSLLSIELSGIRLQFFFLFGITTIWRSAGLDLPGGSAADKDKNGTFVRGFRTRQRACASAMFSVFDSARSLWNVTRTAIPSWRRRRRYMEISLTVYEQKKGAYFLNIY